MIICGRCKQERELGDFYKSKTRKNGRQNMCKGCNATRCLAYYHKNRTKLNKERQARQKAANDRDPRQRIKHAVRNRIRQALNGLAKAGSTMKLIGCTPEELKFHLESLFVDGMHWGQRGKWEIDHIMPVAAFDLSIKWHQEKAFNYKNLQPLWAAHNRIKSDKHCPEELKNYLNTPL